MNKLHSVTVLMSTYNGGRYIREQINSILNQKNVRINLVVRDDGSKDDTLNILEEYKEKGKLSYYTGQNLGPQHSFMHLLQNTTEDEYYAFADQDDYWMEDKLCAAIEKLQTHTDEPALYFGQTQLVDRHLNKIANVVINPNLTFGESLIYAYASGCTMVFSNKLKQILTSVELPSKLPMHDIWLILTNMTFNGYTYFDATPHILYRQHGDNEIGLGHGFVHMWKLRLHHLFSKGNVRFLQALNIYKTYGDRIPYQNKILLKEFIEGKSNFIKRINLIFNKHLRCSDRSTQILFWLNVLINKY